MIIKKCLQCNEEFPSYKSANRKFCNRRCYIKFSSIGTNNPFYGKHHTQKAKDIISVAHKGNKYRIGMKQPQTAGDKNPAKRPEIRKLISKRVKETHWDSSGNNNPFYGIRKFGKDNSAYIHGNSKRKYLYTFNKRLKRKIFERDKFICQKCFIYPSNDLTAHHVDYNKFNDDESNLITLCRKCNSKVNVNREFWKGYFENIIHKHKEVLRD